MIRLSDARFDYSSLMYSVKVAGVALGELEAAFSVAQALRAERQARLCFEIYHS